MNTGSTRTLSSDCDGIWIPTERFDVLLDPLQGQSYVLQRVISRTRRIASGQEAEGIKTVLRSDEDHIAVVHEIGRAEDVWMGRSHEISATVDVEENGVVGFSRVRVGTVNVQIKTVLGAGHPLIGFVEEVRLDAHLGDVVGEEVALGKDFLHGALRGGGERNNLAAYLGKKGPHRSI